MLARLSLLLFLVAMLAALGFASVSTYDFVQHLDRQVHDLHCSFMPGLGPEARPEGGSGCQVALMSPYSSVLRTWVWGGIPISLPAMAVFAFLVFRGFDLPTRPHAQRRAAAGFILIAMAVPVAASAIMGTIAYTELGAACKLCVGIYISSGIGLVAAIVLYTSHRTPTPAAEDEAAPPASGGAVALAGLGQLGAFVGVPVALYLLTAPDNSRFVGTCGALESLQDDEASEILVDLGGGGSARAIEVFDPLCPACRAFERRLAASGLDARLERQAVLFPLDDACNWMVSAAMHPGACVVSEAVLCGADGQGGTAQEVIDWAFEHQDEILKAAKADPAAAERMVLERFAGMEGCVGSAKVRARLNKSLRWAVKHQIPVLTPQLYVDGKKLCDEDTDLGLEYALSRMLEGKGGDR